MKIEQILEVLKQSEQEGLYITRPHFTELQVYVNKAGSAWECKGDSTVQIDLMNLELKVDDWEIVCKY